MGIEWDCLDKEGVYKVEPALKGNESIVGGVFTKSDASGDIHKFCVALSKNLRKKYGVTLNFQKKLKILVEIVILMLSRKLINTHLIKL